MPCIIQTFIVLLPPIWEQDLALGISSKALIWVASYFFVWMFFSASKLACEYI
jgi:hypothetical protein